TGSISTYLSHWQDEDALVYIYAHHVFFVCRPLFSQYRRRMLSLAEVAVDPSLLCCSPELCFLVELQLTGTSQVFLISLVYRAFDEGDPCHDVFRRTLLHFAP